MNYTTSLLPPLHPVQIKFSCLDLKTFRLCQEKIKWAQTAGASIHTCASISAPPFNCVSSAPEIGASPMDELVPRSGFFFFSFFFNLFLRRVMGCGKQGGETCEEEGGAEEKRRRGE